MKSHQTGEPWHLSCHGGKTPANLLSLEYPRALWARCGVQGVTPCCEPEGLSPDGGLRTPTNRKPHQTGEPRGLLPSGGNSAAKLHVPQMLLRPMGGRGVGSRGTIPCASHEAHRRMAVFPIQLT